MIWMRRVFGLTLGLIVFGLCNKSAVAHRTSDAYLSLKISEGGASGRLDLALKDLEFAVGLDTDGDGSITWSELQAKQQTLFDYSATRLKISAQGQPCPIKFTDMMVDYHNDGGYAVLLMEVTNVPAAGEIEINYGILFEHDASHRGLFQLDNAGVTQSSVFTITTALQKFRLERPTWSPEMLRFGADGVWHIWTGYDHILFLLALLFPAVLTREQGQWKAISNFRQAFINVFKIVTAFTLAHSITLTLATIGVVRLPSRLVESSIAASVILAATNNVAPFFQGRAWAVAFAFGLIHGFGFANVLVDLGLPKGTLAISLVSFNLGVELGQLAIVSVFLPLAYQLRASWIYRSAALNAGSVVIIIIAATWMWERIFDTKFLPF